MLRLKEWNEILDYAEKTKEELVNQGTNVKVKPYLMYNNEKGAYFVIYDKRIENEIYLGVGTDNTLGRALLAAMSDNQLEQCEYFE